MTRRSRDELRTLMLEAGCELVRRRSLAFDPPSLTYANVFQHLDDTRDIRLHRSQVHGRIWESQDHYRTEVVVKAIRSVLPTSAEIDESLNDLTGDLNIDNLQDLVKGWLTANIGNSLTTDDRDLGFDLFVAAHALSQEDSTTSVVITSEVTAHLSDLMRDSASRYRTAATELGLEPANELGIDGDLAISLLVRNAPALVEGARLMNGLGGPSSEPVGILDDEGNPQSIDEATLGLMVLIEQLSGLDS